MDIIRKIGSFMLVAGVLCIILPLLGLTFRSATDLTGTELQMAGLVIVPIGFVLLYISRDK